LQYHPPSLAVSLKYSTNLIQVVYGYNNPEKLLSYNVALLSICFMIFLGFADDVLNLRWRDKFVSNYIRIYPSLLCESSFSTSH
jgi:UDP-N-acetylmuramyl pentapeptide phosphotransferase/UDP-N-acetylglucosamine-1-phosphate transferase